MPEITQGEVFEMRRKIATLEDMLHRCQMQIDQKNTILDNLYRKPYMGDEQ